MSFINNPSTGGGGGGITNINVSAGTTSNNLSNLVFSNSNGVTFGLNGSTVTASVGAAGGGLTNVNISAGTTSNNLSNFVFSNSNGLSFGLNGSTVTGSYTIPSQSTQPVALSGSNGSFAFSTGTFGASNGLTFYTTNGSMVGSYTVPSTAGLLSNVNLSAGTTSQNLSNFVFSNSNGVSFGLNGSTVTAAHNAITQQSTQPVAVSGSNGSFAFSTATFGNLNGLSFYTSNGSLVGSYTVPSQSTQPVAASGTNGSFAFSTLSFGNSNGMLFYSTNGSVVGSYTVPSTAGLLSAVNVSAGTTSTNASAFTFSNANSISFGLGTGASAGVITATASYPAQTSQSAIKGLGASNTGNTAGNTGLSTGIDWVIAGSQALTVSQSTVAGGPNTLWLNAPNAAAGNVTISAGTSSAGLASLVFSNLNGVSFGLNGSTITGSVNAGGGGGIGAGVSTGGNTAGSTGTITTGNLILVGGSNISLSQSTGAAGSNATVTINAPASSSIVGVSGVSISTNGSTISVYDAIPANSRFVNEPSITQVGTVAGNSLVSIAPIFVQNRLDMSNLRFGASVSGATQTNTSSAFFNVSLSAVLYTLSGSSLSSVLSGSNSYSIVHQSNSTTSKNGIRAMTVNWASSTQLQPGEYWVAVHISTNNTATGGTATTALGHSMSMLVGASAGTAAMGMDPMGVATAATRGASIGLGLISTGATLASIPMSSITQSGTAPMVAKLWLDFRNYSIW